MYVTLASYFALIKYLSKQTGKSPGVVLCCLLNVLYGKDVATADSRGRFYRREMDKRCLVHFLLFGG